ncbi:MAG: hypothetical protein ACI89X_003834 [Planctomycetota bacterium]|jgi:hypothetical protein
MEMTGHPESAVRPADLSVPVLAKPFDLIDLLETMRRQAETPGGRFGVAHN